MKQCEYCGKEISYYDQYCSDECQKNAVDFYEKKEKYTGLFSVLCAVCVLSIGVGIFMFAFFAEIGTAMVVGCCAVLALLLFFLPFPTDNMISKYKVKKAVKYTKYVALGVLLIGVAFLIFSLIF